MLNKIENISPNAAYKEKPNYAMSTKEVSHTVSNIAEVNDFSSLSEAIKFWGILKWKLKQFKKNSNGKIEIDFSIDDLSFHVSLSEPYYQSQLSEYEIYYELGSLSDENKKKLKILIKSAAKESLLSANPTELFFLRTLFYRIFQFIAVNPDYEIKSETEQILFYELKEGLASELSDIHTKLILFLDKVTNNTFNPLHNHSDNQDELQSNEIEILGLSLK